MDDHGTPSARCARRSVSATRAASWVELSATRMRTSPGWAPGTRTAGRRWLPASRGGPRAGAGRRRRDGGQQGRAAAAAGAQRHHRRGLAVGGAEPLGKLGQRAHVGAAERVDGLVRVTDRDQLPAVAGQRHQQGLLGRVAVLVLVDQHHVVGGRARAAGSPPGRAGRRRSGRSRRSRRPGPGPGRSGPRTGPGRRRPPSSRRGRGAGRAGAGCGRPGRARPRAAAGRAPPRRSPGWPGAGRSRSGQRVPPSWASPRSIRRISSSCSGAESSRGGSSPASTNSRRASA